MSEPVHDNRVRAESFGANAAEYDAARPSYPDALITDLLTPRPSAVLDVGCGTGKAARLITARGVPILGVEVDDRMAAVARASGIPVEVASFESWPDGGRTFDLIISGQAWHWIDPEAGLAKAARVLKPGGLLAPFWNYAELAEPLRSRIDEAYRRWAPSLISAVVNTRPAGRLAGHLADLGSSDRFDHVERRTYPWQQDYSRDAWLRMITTHSDHALLPDQQLASLRQAIGAAIDEAGGVATARYETHLVMARRAA